MHVLLYQRAFPSPYPARISLYNYRVATNKEKPYLCPKLINKKVTVRTRYAPSPTGFQHIGGIRTALYAYLFAKNKGGKLVLRIEDTDQKRTIEGAEKYILDAFNWFGMEADEGVDIGGEYGPYRQSDRKEIYAPYAVQLVESGHAYYAFDTPQDLEAMRERLQASGSSNQQYNALTRAEMRNSLSMSKEEVEKAIADGEQYVIRFKLPENETVTFQDRVREEVSFNTNQMDDKVLFKSDGMPTYHMANVIDDYSMKITHVIRGEEWLSSTPLHVLLYRALGWGESIPEFAHLPLMLNPDGKGKLSKRKTEKLGFPTFPIAWEHPTDGTSSTGFKEMGFLPDAFRNFLAFQGWNPGTEQEIFSMQELQDSFSLDRVTKSGSRFDIEKAKWYNQEYIMAKSDEDLAKLVLEWKPENSTHSLEEIMPIVPMMKERMVFPQDFWTQGAYFFEQPSSFDQKTIKKKWNEENKASLQALAETINQIEDFKSENIEKNIKAFIEEKELSFGNVFQPLRLALTGMKGGPSLFDIAEILGKEEVGTRLQKAFIHFDEMVEQMKNA